MWEIIYRSEVYIDASARPSAIKMKVVSSGPPFGRIYHTCRAIVVVHHKLPAFTTFTESAVGACSVRIQCCGLSDHGTAIHMTKTQESLYEHIAVLFYVWCIFVHRIVRSCSLTRKGRSTHKLLVLFFRDARDSSFQRSAICSIYVLL